jgi:MoaA/NifB/PqqE/SkfB family radical SAM enzyme
MEKICGLLKKGRCPSVHIGGGEPFLDFEGLLAAVRIIRRCGIELAYIETNAFWAGDKKAPERIKRLAAEGVRSLCISTDPFHAEYVPSALPLALAALCDDCRMGYFLWQERYLPLLERAGLDRALSRAELERSLGGDYPYRTAESYRIDYGGRAVAIEDEFCEKRSAEEFLDEDTGGCAGLLSTGHFHVDLDGNFIPPGCTGIVIPLEEAVTGIPEAKYPAFEALYSGGVGALFRLAAEKGFSPDREGYASKCNLCFRLRAFLAEQDGFPELDADHYRESLTYC